MRQGRRHRGLAPCRLSRARGLRLDRVRGFVFDVDGTLVHRGPDGRARPQPGAVDVLERIRASGRPLVLFTNGSHVGAETIARGLREDGLPVADDELLTPVESAITYLRRRHRDQPALLFCSAVIRERIAAAGIALAGEHDEPGVVFVAHVDECELAAIERAADAVWKGAALLTGSYVRAYAGANGPIISRGAMVTAAIAKGGGARRRSSASRRAPPWPRSALASACRERARRDRRRSRHGHRARAPRRLAHGARAQRHQRRDRARPGARRPAARRGRSTASRT